MKFKLTTEQGEFESVPVSLIEKINEIMFLNAMLIAILEQCNIEEPTIVNIIDRIKELNAEVVVSSTEDVNISVNDTFSAEVEGDDVDEEIDHTNVVKFTPKIKKTVEDIIA